MGTSAVLELKGIKKAFGGIQALKGVDFELDQGEVHALLGENGAGKSTLIKIITGVYQADEGQMLFGGTPIMAGTPIDARKKGIAAIYQELSLIESLTVAENIFLGNEPTITPFGIYDRTALYKNSQDYLTRFGIGIDCRKTVSELGMGQKRIIEIVKALAVNSRILLLDEPTTGMSQVEIETLFQIMENLKQKNVTMIYISHYLDEVFRIADRATVFRDGENIETFRMNQVTKPELIRCMIGKTIHGKIRRAAKSFQGADIILELEGFKTNQMKAPVSLVLRKSEILGITGIVGAGKSELAHSMFGNARVESGQMRIHGQPVHFRNPHSTIPYKLGFVPEDRKAEGLFLGESIADNMVTANISQIERKFGILDQKKKREICMNVGERLGVYPLKPDLPAGNLSGGNQQKVVIGKWLTSDPEILIMDEPTRGIDVGAKSEIYDIICELADKGKSVLIMSSEFEELVGLCDRILVLYKGSVAGELMPEEATNETLLSLSLGGE